MSENFENETAVDELGLPVASAADDEAERERKSRQSFKPTQATLSKLLNYLSEDPIYAHAMRACGYRSSTLIFQWIKRARERTDPDKWTIAWPDPSGPRVWLDDAILLARAAQCARFEATLRRDAHLGSPRILRNPQTGEPCWEHDAVVMADYPTKELADAAGIRDWPYKHDPQTGGRIPIVVYDVMPASARVHVARSVLGDAFNPSDRRSIDQRVSGGVLIVKKTTAQGSGDAAIAASAPPPYSREAMSAGRDGDASPLHADLLRRLEDLRARPDRASARPTGPVNVGAGRGAGNDPPEGGAA